jgi:hypothetical protein
VDHHDLHRDLATLVAVALVVDTGMVVVAQATEVVQLHGEPKEAMMHRSREDMPTLTISQNLLLMDGQSILLQRDMCITIIQKLEFRSGNDRQRCNKRTYKIL